MNLLVAQQTKHQVRHRRPLPRLSVGVEQFVLRHARCFVKLPQLCRRLEDGHFLGGKVLHLLNIDCAGDMAAPTGPDVLTLVLLRRAGVQHDDIRLADVLQDLLLGGELALVGFGGERDRGDLRLLGG